MCRIQRRLEQGENQKRPHIVKKREEVPPPSDSTATRQSLPPLPGRKTSPFQQSNSRNKGPPTELDQQSSRSGTHLCPTSHSGNREGKAPSPVCSEGSSSLPVEQTQEDGTEDLVMSKIDSSHFSYISRENLALDNEQAEAEIASYPGHMGGGKCPMWPTPASPRGAACMDTKAESTVLQLKRERDNFKVELAELKC